MTWAASRTPAGRWAAAWPSPAITPARPARPTNCARTSTKALSLIPGQPPVQPARLLRRDAAASKVDRDEIERARSSRTGSPGPSRSASAWTSTRPTSRIPRSAGGFTLTQRGQGHPPVLDRALASAAARSARPWARRSGNTCLTNLWIPDGMKDTPADRRGPRERLAESLDAIFKKKLNPKHNVDCRGAASSSASARRATRPARTSSTSATP